MSLEVSSFLFEVLKPPGFLPSALKPDLLTFGGSLLEGKHPLAREPLLQFTLKWVWRAGLT